MLDEIIAASRRLNGVAHRTGIFTSTQLNKLCNCEIFLKAENLQRGGAFKMRGAYNTISQLSDKQKETGIITHSSGNHAQAVAITGNLLDIPTTIVMPNNAPKVKVEATRGYGAEVVFCDPTQKARENTVNELIDKFGYTLIHPYDNDNIIAGAATASMELIEDVPDLDFILTPVGGGGLICGTALYTKLTEQNIQVIAAEPEGADDAYRSFTEGIHVQEQDVNTIADGLRTTLSERTLGYIKEYVDDIITVSDTEIIEMTRFLFERMKLVVEPSGATPVAAVKKDERFNGNRVGIIISGGNIDLNALFDTLKPQDNKSTQDL